MVDQLHSKTGWGVTLCQFGFDLRHHLFRHEKALRSKIWGLLFCRPNETDNPGIL